LFQRDVDAAGFIIQRTSTNRWVFGASEQPSLGTGFSIYTYPVGAPAATPRLFIDLDGMVGIGTTSPNAKLDVRSGGDYDAALCRTDSAVYGVNGGNDAKGYIGGEYGVYGDIDDYNYGYLGGGNYGAYGAYGNGNYGFLGSAIWGVYGYHGTSHNTGSLGGGDYGVYGEVERGVSNCGVYGKHHASENYGYLGGDDYGVYGWAKTGGSDYGVYGKHNTSGNYGYLGGSDYGVYGSSSSGTGVRGDSPSGNGVAGASTSGTGVYGQSSSGYGIHGTSDTGWAGYFSGKVKADKASIATPSTPADLSLPVGGTIGIASDSANYLYFWTKNIAGGTIVDHIFAPYDSNHGYLGNSVKYWMSTYAGTYYGKNTTIQSFDIYDDLAVASAIKVNKHTIIDRETGEAKEVDVFDAATMPAELRDASGEFVDLNALNGFLLGCVRQAQHKIAAQQEQIQTQEAKIAEQQAQLQSLLERIEALENKIK